jgi:hypothetical protein
LNAAYISAFFGLMGALVGGVTSIGTAWVTQRTERRDLTLQAERTKREGLYGDFLAEASRLYGDALSHEKDDVTDLVQLYALVAKMRLFAPPDVLDAAEQAMHDITETYLAPNRNLRELRTLAGQGGMNFLLAFSEACRSDLAASSPGAILKPWTHTGWNNRKKVA